MKAPKVLILGAGGHGRVVLEALRSKQSAAAFLDASEELQGRSVDGVRVEGGDEKLEKLSPRKIVLVNGVGADADVGRRRAVFESARAKGFRFPPVVAGSAVVSTLARLDEGAQILTRAIVHPGASVGENVVVNTAAVVEHDVELGAHAFVGPGAVLLGGCRVGRSCFVGGGAVVLPGVSIGDGALIGAGAVVTADVPAGARYAGVPARSLAR